MSAKGKQNKKPTPKTLDVSQSGEEIPGGSVVYELNWSCRRLRVIEGLEKYTKLRILDLSCNSISAIRGLSGCTELKELKLYSNQIEGVVEGLQRLVHLVHLMLQFNKITSLGCGVSKLNRLQLLRVDNNLLTKITPEMFSGSADLVHLDLGNNHLVQFKCGHMLPGVTHLNLSYNQLSSFPEDILQCSKLEELNVSGNPLMAVKPLKTLKVLYAQDMLWDSTSALSTMKHLQQLHLARNRISTLDGLCESCPSLVVLDVRWNVIGSMAGLQELKRMDRLQELYLEGNPLSYEREHIKSLSPNLSVVDQDDGRSHQRPVTPTHRPATPLQQPLNYKKIEQEFIQRDEIFKSLHDNIHSKNIKPHPKAYSLVFTVLLYDHLFFSFTCLFSELEELDENSSGSLVRPKSRANNRARLDHAKQFANQTVTNN